jgi:hypothetical protein
MVLIGALSSASRLYHGFCSLPPSRFDGERSPACAGTLMVRDTRIMKTTMQTNGWRTRTIMFAAGLAVAAGIALAQDANQAQVEVKPKEKPFGGATLAPVPDNQPAAPAPVFSEPEFEKIAGLLTGTWKSSKPIRVGADSFEVITSVAPVFVPGMTDTFYAEVARGDALDRPYRQAIWQLQRVKGNIRLKTLEFRRTRGEQLAAVGLWAVPDKFPMISSDELVTTLMVELTADGAGYRGSTPHAYPTSAGSAVEMTSQIAFDGTTFKSADRGFAADGTVAWGPPEGEFYEFARIENPIAVTRTPEGLVMLTYNTVIEGEVFKAGDRIAVHYMGMLANGTLFDSSYERQAPYEYNFGQPLIPGWDMGMTDARKGLKRRLVIPGPLGYAERGNARAKIPPNATLVFAIDVLSITAAPPPPAPPEPVQAQPVQEAPKPAEAKPTDAKPTDS